MRTTQPSQRLSLESGISAGHRTLPARQGRGGALGWACGGTISINTTTSSHLEYGGFLFDSYSQVKKISIGVGVAVVVVLLISGVIFYWIRSAEETARQLAIAEEKENRADALFEESKRIQTENARLIQSLVEQQEVLSRSIAGRNQVADRSIAAARAPKTTEQVVKDSTTTLGVTPVVRDNSLAFTTQQVQEIIAKELDRVRLEQNLKDTQHQLALEREKVSKYEVTLTQANQLIADQREVIEAYKKVAKKTGWQKAAAIGQRIGEIVVTGVIVGVIAK